ncbi:MAG: hypothetical protein WBC85_00920 [Planktotalea sp.]
MPLSHARDGFVVSDTGIDKDQMIWRFQQESLNGQDQLAALSATGIR